MKPDIFVILVPASEGSSDVVALLIPMNAGCAIVFNLLWRHLSRAELLVARVAPEFVRDVTVRYLLGPIGYVAATLLALILPLLTVLVSTLLALMFALRPSVRHPSPRQTVLD
ncbi:MAG: hypothetical protein WCC65_11480 [Pseudonocardiaceae bacterium]